ncbi:NAD(+) diphosphatase [Nocardioides sp. CER19]|uniref:NAD(+) diphosphatase n=1 Tax=Nocardioides sp. CER19 TaxID=3038538 RepID=UPI00244A4C6B|nr:NAD(+) diphosphatase [Nocardioides sp. CER19]MDH2415197.1 NAD(+) diphosphatase [Nocardioides sp. CER19]
MPIDLHPHERLAWSAHDRLHAHRDDDDWVDRRWSDPESRALVVAGNRVRLDGDRIEWTHPKATPPGIRLLLGDSDGRTHFAVILDAARDSQGPGEGWVPLRGLLPTLAGGAPDGEAPLVLHALGMAEWLHATRFCPRCGGPLSPRASGHQLICSDGHQQFPRTDPAVIMLITTGEPGTADERCLLGRQKVWPEGRFSTLAGFCEPGESLENSVRREVAEETGVRVGEVSYFGNQPWPLPASLMLGFTGRADSTEIRVDDDEIAEARWLTRAELEQAATSGEIQLPGAVSISRSLIETWYGAPLPGTW